MQSLNCQGEIKPCQNCLACRKTLHGNHPDLFIFDHEEQTLKIETIRELQHSLALSPVEGRYRVALLTHFDKATPGAANALLKTLEEPPPQVIIMLTAPDTNSLLATIVSRCQILTLRPLPQSEISQGLQTHWQIPPDQADLLAQLAGGRVGWALRALQDEHLLTRRQQRLQDLLTLLAANRVDRMDYAAKLSQDVALLKETLVFWITMSRDLMLLHTGCQTEIINFDWREQLQPLARRLTINQIKPMVTGLRQTLINLDRNVNPRLSMDVALLKLPRL
jgi:DNA polymerase-3 subunit delta'